MRRGMTLIEMLVALLIFSFVMAGALSVLSAESRSFALGSERVAMYQNGRFAMNELEKDLRTAGAGAPDVQPQMIYINDSVVVFNANYWTNTAGDVEAVYYNPDAPDSAVLALRKSTPITIPHTSIQYPDTNYVVGGVNSSAETISFYFEDDTTTSRSGDYVLYRRVNRLKPEIVATNILHNGATPFFQYFRLVTPAGGGTSSLTPVDTSELPLQHTVPVHLSLADTGVAAAVDSIRAVRVDFTVSNGRTGDAERLRTLTRLILLPNVGLANTRSCGDQPIFAAVPTVLPGVAGGGGPTAELRWLPSVDESSGERDVERYVIWRKIAGAPDWGDPYVTVPAGDSTYLYADANVTSGTTYQYAVAAQDCTPTLSAQRASPTVTIP